MKEQDSQREKNTKRKSSKLSEIIEENLNLSGEGEACFEFLSLNDEFQVKNQFKIFLDSGKGADLARDRKRRGRQTNFKN